MPNVGPLEIVLIVVIALVVLGPRRLPDFGRSVGRGLREFKGALSGASMREAPDEEDRGEQLAERERRLEERERELARRGE